MMLPALTLWQREMVRFFRQRDRVVGALLTPIVFWLLLGLGLGHSFNAPGGYLQYFYAGTMVMILLFTAIFSTISVIEDRREGFLQAVLVAPVGRFAIVLGKLLGGTTLAFVQGLVFLVFAPWVGVTLTAGSLVWLVLVMLLVSFALTGLGFVIAWQLNSTQGFHAIMNLFLIPLWLLSGAVFPASGAPAWLGLVMRVNPLSYGVTAIRAGLYGGMNWAALCVTTAFAVMMFAVSMIAAQRTTAGDLQ